MKKLIEKILQIRFLRVIAAKRYGVKFRVKEWYNFAAHIHKSDWKYYFLIECFDETGAYIDCPRMGGTLVVNDHGKRRFLYRVVGFRNGSAMGDWIYDSDIYNPISEFVKTL